MVQIADTWPLHVIREHFLSDSVSERALPRVAGLALVLGCAAVALLTGDAVSADAGPDKPSVEVRELLIDPPTVTLTGPGQEFALLVDGKGPAGQLVDLTRAAEF